MITTRHTRGLSVPQICTITGAEPGTVRSWIHRGHLSRNQWGRVEPVALAKYLVERGTVGQHKHARQHGLQALLLR